MKVKKFYTLASYVLVAVLASVLTFAVCDMNSDDGPGKLEQLENLINNLFIGEADQTAMEDAAAAAMIDSLGDRWSYYIPADQYGSYMEQMKNAYVGIGVTIQVVEGEPGFYVTKVNEGGPADQAGMLPGDRLVAVDGVDVTEMNVEEASSLVKGKENTTVDLTVLREGDEVVLTVTRMLVQTPVAVGTMLENGVGLITIVNFDARCAEETIAAMEALLEQGATKLVFDVRFNPGGYVDELVKVLDYILPEGDLFRSVNYKGEEDVEVSDAKCLENIPMAVLVNGDSYSAAEFFAAALSEYGYAVIVGEPTVGKGYYQSTFQLGDGSAVGLSIGKYFTPNGRSLAEEGGIVPDVVITVDMDTAMNIYSGMLDPAEDPQIQAAIEAMGN
jgi:carboxyl-terminal processing protease